MKLKVRIKKMICHCKIIVIVFSLFVICASTKYVDVCCHQFIYDLVLILEGGREGGRGREREGEGGREEERGRGREREREREREKLVKPGFQL